MNKRRVHVRAIDVLFAFFLCYCVVFGYLIYASRLSARLPKSAPHLVGLSSVSSPVAACIDPTSAPYFAHGDGVTDDTAALNAAIADAQTYSTPVCLPPGTFLVSTLAVATSPAHLPLSILGAGPDNTTIKTSSPTGDVLTLYKSGLIAHIAFTSSVTRVSGAYLVFASGANDTTLTDFSLRGAATGILVQSGGTNRIQNGSIRDTIPGGDSIILDGGNDHYISYVTMDGAATSQPHAGIWHRNSGATHISHCDIIHQGYDLIVNGGSLWVDHTYFDTAVRGVYMQALYGPILRTYFDNVWTCSHTGNGFLITNGPYPIGTVSIDHLTACFNGAHGLAVTNIAGDTDFRVSHSFLVGNAGVGAWIAGGMSRWSITDSTLGSSQGIAGNGSYGLYVDNGTGDRFIISNLDLTGNGVGPYYIGASGARRAVTGLIY